MNTNLQNGSAPQPKVAVIGAGSMGAGIAALCASAGLEVVLLDQDADAAARGVETQLKRGGFYLEEDAARISTGSDYALLEDCDWVIEAIFEDLSAKHSLYTAIEAHLSPTAIVSSNTSTLPLSALVEGVAPTRRERFAITHFFNPPKVMPLVELVVNSSTDETSTTADTLRRIIEVDLGKTALPCRDTPGFIANRVGCYWLACGVFRAREFDIDYALADAAFGRAFGIPRTGIFGLLDYIGLQLVAPIWNSLENALDPGDRMFSVPLGTDEFIAELVKRGHTGRSAGSGGKVSEGFYRGRDEVIDSDFNYVARTVPEDPVIGLKDPREVMSTDSPGGRFARALFLDTLSYCGEVAPEIAEHVGLIDEGFRLGFGWKKGIFELADEIGLDWLVTAYDIPPQLLVDAAAAGGFYPEGKVLSSSGEPLTPEVSAGVVTLATVREKAHTLLTSPAGALHLLDNNVAILDFHTPLNSLSNEAIALIHSTLDAIEPHAIAALVIGNDKPVFSAGADLPSLAAAAESASATEISAVLNAGSQALLGLKYCPIPVIGAVRGVALGGGFEMALACDRLVLHADARLAFPELNVGLYPGWTGTVALLSRLRAAGVSNAHQRAFNFITATRPAPNAFAARRDGLLRPTDVVLLSFDRILARALEEAAALAADYTPPADEFLPLYSGPALDREWPLENTTANDHAIAAQLARMYTGTGELTFRQFAEREVAFDVPLLLMPANVERALHMARTRKPLHN
ncbi:FAD-dependent oxidoreductase [Corynebacterium flavescens]|uniref:FAD-dependent oxidoreductase n=1 Tax=Corynebacterium flavescens TaxID=28028 RepID=UPI000EE161F2|nr:3-hydroxyacyl-CoA dehydrogenase [Corynebacterium flavescens]